MTRPNTTVDHSSSTEDRPIVVLSNRGPISYRVEAGGDLAAVRGAGGLVSGLAPLMSRPNRLWLAAALSDADRAATLGTPRRAGSGSVDHASVEVDGITTAIAAIDADDLRRSYEVVCNATLWYLHHHLFPLASQPVFDRSWFDAWDAYRRVNTEFAALAADLAPDHAVLLVQDYHLALVGPILARQRPDITAVHFSHTPFADPGVFRILPDGPRRQLLEGLSGHAACGFHTERWRRAFEACCDDAGVTAPHTFVAPLGPDPADLAKSRATAAFAIAAARVDEWVGDRLVIARSDRIELSKNLIRGFQAFGTLLDEHPDLHDRVCFVASVYPSRLADPNYAAYHRDMLDEVHRVNERFSTACWTPIVLDTNDDHPLSMAMLARADVVLVNAIRDGMNLVASEAVLINERDALLALSPETGAWDTLGAAATAVHPYDITQTADTLHALLSTPAAERAVRAEKLRALARSRTATDWLSDQLAAASI